MGTIVTKPRKDGSTAYVAQIAVRRNGRSIREAKSFDREQAANAWIKKRAKELDKPGAVELAAADSPRNPRLKDAIERTLAASKRLGRTKKATLKKILTFDIAELEADKITSADLVAFAEELGRSVSGSTVANYLSHISQVFKDARHAWNMPFDSAVVENAKGTAKSFGHTAPANKRTRRPSLAELDKLLSYFERLYIGDIELPADFVREHGKTRVPMHKILAFAIFSTRRQSEITRIRWDDLAEEDSRIMVRDLKDPNQKIGNDVWLDLPTEALRIIKSMPRVAGEIFPFRAGSISTLFTSAVRFCGVEDLIFHDLRHDGVSRLFELGWGLPHVAQVSGHRNWKSLSRYTHIRQKGDKYAGWKWLDVIAPK